ncbi:hypothetical protein LXL04_027367 [Taraxacum kok-saghyz]
MHNMKDLILWIYVLRSMEPFINPINQPTKFSRSNSNPSAIHSIRLPKTLQIKLFIIFFLISLSSSCYCLIRAGGEQSDHSV